ncbi:hypothetical protein D3C74_366700 [compost metagenome]
MDGSIKLAARALPVYRAEREAGRDGRAALRLISAWCEQLGAQRSAGKPIADANSKAIETVLADASLSAGSREQTAALVAVIDTGLARSNEAIEAITDLRGSFAN